MSRSEPCVDPAWRVMFTVVFERKGLLWRSFVYLLYLSLGALLVKYASLYTVEVLAEKLRGSNFYWNVCESRAAYYVIQDRDMLSWLKKLTSYLPGYQFHYRTSGDVLTGSWKLWIRVLFKGDSCAAVVLKTLRTYKLICIQVFKIWRSGRFLKKRKTV